MVNILEVTDHRPVKLGYAAGILIAFVVLIAIPIHWLVSGSSTYLILTLIWGVGRACQAIFVTILMLKDGAKPKAIMKEVIAFSLYWWRPT